jgi:RNA polymerase sigma factor (sigma-70 family)
MDEHDLMATRFEENRPHLHSVAYRMLGSASEADDAVQEAWLRLSRTGDERIENLGGWLTTVVARVCLDMIRARSRREEGRQDDTLDAADPESDPESDAIVADSIGLAMLVVLEQLTPAERVAFVLHDLFDLPFDEIAPIVDRSPAAARQLASRARRRVRGASPTGAPDGARQREIVGAFLAASKGGDFQTLLALLDPDVVMRSDPAAAAMGSPELVSGREAVATFFSGSAKAARPALLGGEIGLVWAPGRVTSVAFVMTFGPESILGIEFVADPDRLAQLDPVLLPR